MLQIIAATCLHQPNALLDAYPPDGLWNSKTHYDPVKDGMPKLRASTGINQASCYFLSRLHTGVFAACNAAAFCARHRNTGSVLMLREEALDEGWYEFFGESEDLCIA